MGNTLGRTPGHWDLGKEPIAGIQKDRQSLLGSHWVCKGSGAAGDWTPGHRRLPGRSWDGRGSWHGAQAPRLRVQETNTFQTSETRRDAGRTKRQALCPVGGACS